MATTSSPYPTSSAVTPSCRCFFCLQRCCWDHAVLPAAQRTDIYLAALGIVLTLIYAAGLLFRPRRRIAPLGVDSLAVVIPYGLGMIGLLTVSNMR